MARRRIATLAASAAGAALLAIALGSPAQADPNWHFAGPPAAVQSDPNWGAPTTQAEPTWDTAPNAAATAQDPNW
ncbi:hypothetical protein [Streptomyces sp. BPTC-684]|uniref:hypothetical protein n=1 Tax=Streptomyces sp. BPTC-684 TaxID=3043734 RepID=UPI0024B25407|nr:hypothetical protein [Streptomyces sp. BPTC-684]WHM36286.1 hypothetical protein QIY60_04650 [Streptomyces sp. BPTC-684]